MYKKGYASYANMLYNVGVMEVYTIALDRKENTYKK